MRIRVPALTSAILSVAILLNATGLWSQETLPAPGSCTIAGTWYGGGDPLKYLMTIIPRTAGGNDYTVIADGAYSLATIGFPVKTTWTGSIARRVGHPAGSYESSLIALLNPDAGFPPSLPQLHAVHAFGRLIDCDTLTLDYDFFGGYFWPTDKKPFLSPPDYVVVPPPFSETYRRMSVKCTQCTQP